MMSGREVAIIRANYKTSSLADLSSKLKITEDTLRMRASRLNLSKSLSHEIRYKIDFLLDMIENLLENEKLNKELFDILRAASNQIFLEVERLGERK